MRNENEMYSKIFRRIREDRRLTQYQMAELAECSLRNYQNIEAGISQPSYRTLNNTVTSCTIDGKKVIEAKDRAKSKASLRTLPLVPAFREKLLEVKKQQEEYKRLCGRSYCKDYLDYICVDPIGERISPNYITAAFPQLLVKNGLRRIRFHDLRHSCASLLLANGVPMKQIQEWLGHSDFSTTANFYAHLEYQSKMSSASAMMQGVDLSGITGA